MMTRKASAHQQTMASVSASFAGEIARSGPISSNFLGKRKLFFIHLMEILGEPEQRQIPWQNKLRMTEHPQQLRPLTSVAEIS